MLRERDLLDCDAPRVHGPQGRKSGAKAAAGTAERAELGPRLSPFLVYHRRCRRATGSVPSARPGRRQG